MTEKWIIEGALPLSGFDPVEGAMGFRFTETLTDPASLSTPRNSRFTALKAAVAQVQRMTPNVAKAYNEPLQTEAPAAPPQMPEVSKEVLDARLEAIEARMDSRVAGMSAKLDATLAEIRADRQRFAQVETAMTEIKADVKESAKEAKGQASSIKVNMWTAVLAMAALNVAILGFMQSSFTAGKEQGSALATATSEIKQTQEQLKAMQERLEKQSERAPVPPGK